MGTRCNKPVKPPEKRYLEEFDALTHADAEQRPEIQRRIAGLFELVWVDRYGWPEGAKGNPHSTGAYAKNAQLDNYFAMLRRDKDER